MTVTTLKCNASSKVRVNKITVTDGTFAIDKLSEGIMPEKKLIWLPLHVLWNYFTRTEALKTDRL